MSFAEGFEDTYDSYAEQAREELAENDQLAAQATVTEFLPAPGTCVYRCNRQGRWVVYGESALVVAGEACDVTTKAGRVNTENILGVGEQFQAAGRTFVYGYIAQRSSKRHIARASSGREAREQEYRAKDRSGQGYTRRGRL